MLCRGADDTDTYSTLRRNGGVDAENVEYTAEFSTFYYYYYYYYYSCTKQLKGLRFHFYKNPVCKSQKRKLVNNFLKITFRKIATKQALNNRVHSR